MLKGYIRNNYETADDKELLTLLKKSDREAFTAIYRRYHTLLYTYAMRYLKSRPDVEDILQSVFVKLWMARDAIFVSTSLKSYLFAMTKNSVMNHIRNSNRALQHHYRIAQQAQNYDDDLYMYAERNHLTEVLQLAIRQLPPQQQTVATMRCEGFSNLEIAQSMQLSIHTVNAHCRALMKTLKAHLDSFVKILIICLFFYL